MIGLCCVLLSSCRYWSMYRFGTQFCDYDEYIEVTSQDARTRIDFVDPVLPEPVFSRYLAAQAIKIVADRYQQTQHYTLVNLLDHSDSLGTAIEIEADFSLGTGTPLLAAGRLDSDLSRAFSPLFVDKILSSACSDDFDLSLERLDMRFVLPKIEHGPKLDDILRAFGPAKQSSPDALQFTFDFVSHTSIHHWQRQNSPVFFDIQFSPNGILTKLYLNYHKYQLWLDIPTQQGRLLVIRGDAAPQSNKQ